MNLKGKQSNRRAAFTIIELLTVMSIIVILIGLLVPALNQVRRYAKDLRQRAQLHSIDTALELFHNEFDGYPDSSMLDRDNMSYCGAMKLCEAMLGQDMLGFHVDSTFRQDGCYDDNGTLVPLYGYTPADPEYNENLTKRKGPFLPLDNADVYQMEDIYEDTGDFLPTSSVLCDVYTRSLTTRNKAGMPILYYRADTANNLHDPTLPMGPEDNAGNIYNYYDNYELIDLGKPWVQGSSTSDQKMHEMAQVEIFYEKTQSEKVITTPMPRRPDTYILISAGFDGEYGTSDDICNYRE